MTLYKLSFVISEESAGKFMASVPSLPGCRAWGGAAAEALENLQSVASSFIASYKEHGDTLPVSVEALGVEAGREATFELVSAG